MPTVGSQGDTSPTDQAMNFAASTLGTSALSGGQEPQRRGPARILHAYAGVLFQSRTYLALVYLLLSFPIGLATFIALVAVTATAGGMIITIVGLPILIAAMYAWCKVASVEAQLSNVLLGTHIAEPFDPLPGKPWQWDSIKARARSVMTWRAFVFLLLRFPAGVASLALLSIVASIPVFLLLAPVLAQAPFPTEVFGDAEFYGIAEPTNGLYIFGSHYDRWYEALLFVPIGLLLLPLAARTVLLGGKLSGLFATVALGRPGSPAEPLGKREMQAALAWEGVYKGRAIALHEPKAIAVRAIALAVHFAITAVVLLFLLMLNGLYSPETWWVMWVAWALAMPFALHLGYFIGGHLGAHIGLFLTVNVGFFVIDAVYSPHTWFFWPMVPWIPILLIHAWLTPRMKFDPPTPFPTPPSTTPEPPSPSGPLTFTMTDLASTASAGNDQATVTLAEPPANVAFIQPAPQLTVVPPSTEPAPAAGLLVDQEFRVASIDGAVLELTPKEFELLSLLVASPGKPFSREQLLDKIWTNDYEVTDRTIDTHVLRLRKKLNSHGSTIQTVWGFGYKYQPTGGDAAESAVEPAAEESTGW